MLGQGGGWPLLKGGDWNKLRTAAYSGYPSYLILGVIPEQCLFFVGHCSFPSLAFRSYRFFQALSN